MQLAFYFFTVNMLGFILQGVRSLELEHHLHKVVVGDVLNKATAFQSTSAASKYEADVSNTSIHEGSLASGVTKGYAWRGVASGCGAVAGSTCLGRPCHGRRWRGHGYE